MVYAALGDADRALDLLEKDYADGNRVLWLFYRSVWFDKIRDEPRFKAILQKYRVPEAPKSLWLAGASKKRPHRDHGPA